MSAVGSARSPYERKNFSVLLIVSTLVLQVFFFAPMHVISLNFGEFPVPFVNILAVHLAITFTLILFVFLVVRILELHILTAALALCVAQVERHAVSHAARHRCHLVWLARIELRQVLPLGGEVRLDVALTSPPS